MTTHTLYGSGMSTDCGLPVNGNEIVDNGPTCVACERIHGLQSVHLEWCRHHDAMVSALKYEPRRFETVFAIEKNTPALLAFEQYARDLRAKVAE